jgi:hypothetical protein
LIMAAAGACSPSGNGASANSVSAMCSQTPGGNVCPGGVTYSCPPQDLPSDPSCVRNGESASDGTTTYCCSQAVRRQACRPDPSAQACREAGAGSSLLCSPGAVPVQAGCTPGPANADGTVPYCCVDFAGVGCQPGGDLACPSDRTAYTCDDAGTPALADPSLNCGPGYPAGNGSTSYCCGSGTCTELANYIGGCLDASVAYDCPGSAIPPSDGSTTCAYFGQIHPPSVGYCCTPGPCTPTDVTQACDYPGALPFACVGATPPDQLNTGIYCNPMSGGVGGQSLYCCNAALCGYVNANNYCDVGLTAVSCTPNAMPSQLDPLLKPCTVSPYSSSPPSTVYCCSHA